jgi:hypothetical protein
MSNMDPLLWRLMLYAPLVVVLFVGIVFSLVTWRRHPQVSLLALVAFAIQLFQIVGGSLVFYWVTRQAFGWDGQQRRWFLDMSSLAQTSLSAVAWALILVTLFRWRNLPNRLRGHDGQYLPEDFDRGDSDGFRG